MWWCQGTRTLPCGYWNLGQYRPSFGTAFMAGKSAYKSQAKESCGSCLRPLLCHVSQHKRLGSMHKNHIWSCHESACVATFLRAFLLGNFKPYVWPCKDSSFFRINIASSNSLDVVGIMWHSMIWLNVWTNIGRVCPNIRDIRPLLREIFPASVRARFLRLGMEEQKLLPPSADNDGPLHDVSAAKGEVSTNTNLALKEIFWEDQDPPGSVIAGPISFWWKYSPLWI